MTKHGESRENTQQEAEVTNAVDDEGLDGGGIGGGARVPETDEEVRSEAHAFPAEEHLQEVVGRHQHQHGEGEEREIGKEPRAVRVVGHVADGIDVDEARDRGDDDQHDGGERIDAQHPVEVEHARLHPAHDLNLGGLDLAAAEGVGDENDP